MESKPSEIARAPVLACANGARAGALGVALLPATLGQEAAETCLRKPPPLVSSSSSLIH